jgi:hypothetical protein
MISIRRPTARAAVAGAVTLCAIGLPREARAILCSDLPGPVYLTGTGKEVTAALAGALGARGITIVHKARPSCSAVDSILADAALTGTATYWEDADELVCDLDTAGNQADIGISDAFATTCTDLPDGLPIGVGDFLPLVEAEVFMVPAGSSQRVISRDAAYFVYGFGSDSGVQPWTDETLLFQQEGAPTIQVLVGLAIGVPADRWKGTSVLSGDEMVAALAGASDPEKAFGFSTSGIADANKTTVTALAYQHPDQDCGYFPDSLPGSQDKRNVRDGHYALWAPLHLLTKVDARGSPVSAAAGSIIKYMTGAVDPPAGVDLVARIASLHAVPSCAMRVSRTEDMGAMASFLPDRSCACYFDDLTTGVSGCTACTEATDCPTEAPACNYGFCEPQ